MNSALMFSKASDEWSTPDDLFRAVFHEFGCTIDAAATRENSKCDFWYGPGSEFWPDALDVYWSENRDQSHWCNPPYSRCKDFVTKAAVSRQAGVETVMLLPARTDTRWFHDYLWDSTTHRPQTGIEIRLLKGRLKFGDGKNSAPFPSMLVVFRP